MYILVQFLNTVQFRTGKSNQPVAKKTIMNERQNKTVKPGDNLRKTNRIMQSIQNTQLTKCSKVNKKLVLYKHKMHTCINIRRKQTCFYAQNV
jgi:hypothetical protein